MAKPISVLYIPDEYSVGVGGRIITPHDVMKELSETQLYEDYLWLCFIKPGLSAPELQVFNVEHEPESTYQQLLEQVVEKLKAVANENTKTSNI